MRVLLFAMDVLKHFHTVCLNVKFQSSYQLAQTSAWITQSSTALFIIFFFFFFFFLLWILAHISELGSCVKSDPSVQLSLNVCKCPSLNTEHWRVCIDVFVLFKKKVISSGLSFEFTRLWIIDQNSSNLQNPWHRLSHLILSINLGVKVLISPH